MRRIKSTVNPAPADAEIIANVVMMPSSPPKIMLFTYSDPVQPCCSGAVPPRRAALWASFEASASPDL
jgi:hypothetical protein